MRAGAGASAGCVNFAANIFHLMDQQAVEMGINVKVLRRTSAGIQGMSFSGVFSPSYQGKHQKSSLELILDMLIQESWRIATVTYTKTSLDTKTHSHQWNAVFATPTKRNVCNNEAGKGNEVREEYAIKTSAFPSICLFYPDRSFGWKRRMKI